MAANVQWKEWDGNEMKIDHIDGQQLEITAETEILNSSSIKIRTDIFSNQQTELSNDTKNVGKNIAGSAIESTSKMNDDQNSNSNSSSSISNNNKSENILEAAKLLLKNGSANGTAAAALITTSGTFHLPAPIQQSSSSYADSTATRGSIYHPPIAQINSAPASVRGSGNNNGLSPSPTTPNSKKSKAMAAATSAATGVRLGASVPNPLTTNAMSSNHLKSELGVLDYSSASSTTILPSGAIHNVGKLSSGNIDVSRSSNISNVENQPVNSAYGGRLQFFKDGKFILELARAKDGERGGWVSVPRKLFRSPSATSYTVTPTSALSSVYQNKECSTSLSFSDDNSSVQSSPWQRDHCWKQSTPRRDISKEMCLHYIRPKGVTLTTKALLVANRKKRKPYEVTEIDRNSFKSLFEGKLKSFKVGIGNETLNSDFSTESKKKLKNDILEENTKNLRNGNKISCEEDGSSCSSSATLTGDDCTNGLINTKLSESSGTVIAKSQCTLNELPDLKTERDIKIEKQEEMHTSEDEENIPTTVEGLIKSTKLEMNGEINKPNSNETQDSKVKIESTEGEEKRLKKSKIKIRAKLTTIIQKLIDKVPLRLASLSKNQASTSGAGSSYSSSSSNVLAQKVSPPSSSAASRLVEYHQQHVSPRKRILREFEKVSLEDNSVVAGGKRSRAKGTSTSTTGIMTSQFRCDKSPTNRIQANLRDCNTLVNSTISSSSTVVSNGNHLTSTSSNKHFKSITTTSSAQPRLYSSYSIHSLLSGNSTSNSSNSSNNQKKHSEQAVISSINYQHHQQIANKTDPSHLRTMLASPKSPESNISSCGGKSPSSSTHRKRSPPYVSSMQDSHSRSPISNLNNDYGQRSPHSSTPESGTSSNISHKPRYLIEHSIGSALHSTTAHISQQQGLYSNYMMSPKYVTAPQSSLSPNSSSINVVRSPRHSSAFNSNSQSSKTASTTFSAHIPNSSSSSGLVKRELSPPRSLTASPRDSTPRTVPKKTASIRRQFASPNASTTSSCPSPSDRNSEEPVVQDRKTPIASNQNLLQGSSPSSTVGSINSPFNYYMYPSPANSVPSSHPQSTGPPPPINNTAAAVAAAAAYIPSVVSSPYYHPYILTLAALRHNPLWMHHYPGATPGAAPVLPPPTAASLSPPFHSFPYNGAASIAAAFNGMTAPMSPAVGPHYQQNAAIAAANHHSMLMAPAAGIHSGLNMSALTAHTTKLTDNTTELNTVIKSTPTAQNMEATPTALYPNSIKDELSSDVPLNLSKH